VAQAWACISARAGCISVPAAGGPASQQLWPGPARGYNPSRTCMGTLMMAIIVAGAMGVACAALSVFVVLRRWAFIGEGIAHAGFGGVGTAWLLSLLVATFVHPAAVYGVAVTFCFIVAAGIAMVTRRRQVHTDTAIGIFLVASLAWGFVAYGIYRHVRDGAEPTAWESYLLGQTLLTPHFAIAAVLMSMVVLAVLILLNKELLAYCFDPDLAEVSGVRVGFIHYMLLLLLTLMIVVGMRLMGSLLVTALLVLPGATGLLLARRFGAVMAWAIVVGLAGALAGPLINWHWRFIPEGPAIVLVLVVQFALAFAWSRLR
jgi:ABC-type Mn2+/Zn2+ transport system permease subunit